MNMENFTDLNIDDVEGPNSFISLETNVDSLLADVTQVQKILNSNNVGQYVDVNEIYEKLEELTYILREERIEYVATQLLCKFGVITDTRVEHAFNTEHRESENSRSSYERVLSSNANDPVTCVLSTQNGLHTESFQNNSNSHDVRTEYFDEIPTKKPHSIVHECNLEKNSAQHNDNKDIGAVGGNDETFSHFEIGCQSTNSLQAEAYASVNQDENEVKSSTFAVDHINTGLSNYVVVGVADNNDNCSNDMELFGEEIMEEAKFISGMFPHFELEQILEFLNINRDVENRIDVVSEEILKLQEIMLQENIKMSELIEMKNKVKCNDYSEKCENPEFSQEEFVDLTSDLFVTQIDTNLVCIATDDTHIQNKNEKQLGNCEHISVSDVENNLLAFNDIEALSVQGNSTIDQQRHINCDITSNADRASPLLSDLTTSVLESVALTSELVNAQKEVTSPTLHLVLSPVCDLENSVFTSNSQLNDVLQQKVLLTSHVSPDLVTSASKPATLQHEETQLNILDRIEQSILDTPNFLLEKTPSISQVNVIDEMERPAVDIMNFSANLSSVSKLVSLQNENLPSQINSAIPEVERLTSNIADISSELVSLVSELTSRQPKETESTSQLNCAVPEIERSTSNVANVSSELMPSVSELASSQPKETESTSQLNCAVPEIERSASNVANVSSELMPSVSKLASSQPKETESTSKLNCAVPEIERSTSNVANVSSELMSSVSKLASSQPKETESTSQLNCAVPEIEISTSNIANVSSELMPSVSKLASSQPKETESTSQLNCAVPEIEKSTSNEANVSSELTPSVSKLASPQAKEISPTSQLSETLRSIFDLESISCGLRSSTSELASSSQEVTKLNNAQNELSVASTLKKLNPPSEVPPSISPTVESLSKPLIEAMPSTTQLQNQGCRKKEITYEEFASSLPHVDEALLKEVWAQIGNNYSAVKEFITQQLENVPEDNHYHLLLSMFPQADPKYLQETSLIIGVDEVALKDFIDEQLQKDESDARYHMLLAMFPKVESTYLRAKCIEVGNDDEAMRNLIVELLSMSESDDNYHTLLTVFPESDPTFLREKADRIGNDNEAMKKFVTEYLEEVEAVQFKSLIAVLPDADPEYLQNMYEKLGNNEESIKLFIMEALETKNYPTRESYLKRQEIATLKRKYKEELNIQEFLSVIPDPWIYFRNKKSNENERRHALSYLESYFKTIALDQINFCFQNNNYNLTLTCDQLNKWTGPLQQIREIFQHIITDTEDIPVPFLQEVAFIENKTEMEKFLKRKEQERKEAFKLAKANGELLECQCCFDNELMDVDVSTCAEGHIFCKECIKRSAEVTIGNGNTHFLCLTNCIAEFSLRVIQTVLNPTTFSRMLRRRQLEEVQAAGIQDLENCPFCEFATIPATNSKVFTCFNPDCMRDSCRKCKRASHIPLRCDEVESKEIKVRTMIEDRMTEALVRTCWKCKKKFIKESGCNKMTCGCGAMMCYLCRQPVHNYNHFNGQGGTEFDKCPLYSELDVIHDVAVQEEGIKAKKEVQEQNPDVILRHDPTEMKPL